MILSLSLKIRTKIVLTKIVSDALLYSVGYVTISKNGDVYYIYKWGRSDMHLSRHASGEGHWKSERYDFHQEIRKGAPIRDFKGIEFLGTTGFGLDSLPELYTEYKMKKCDGIFAVDMRNFKDAAFNMSIAILTKEGLSNLYDSWQKLKKRQIYLFTDCHPMIAIKIADAKLL